MFNYRAADSRLWAASPRAQHILSAVLRHGRETFWLSQNRKQFLKVLFVWLKNSGLAFRLLLGVSVKEVRTKVSEFRVKAGKLDCFLMSENAQGKGRGGGGRRKYFKTSCTFANPQVIKHRKSH